MSAEAAAGAATRTQRYSVHDPPHPGVGGTHLCHLNPLTKTSRGGSSPMSPPTWKHCPSVMVHLVCLIHMPLTISDHLRLRPPTLWCHSDTHCVSSHNHATPVTGLNSDQCLISPDFVPMSWATTYLSFSPYAAFA